MSSWQVQIFPINFISYINVLGWSWVHKILFFTIKMVQLIWNEMGCNYWVCKTCHIKKFTDIVVSDSLWPFGLEPTRLLCPWDSPNKNTGVGCHFRLQGIFPTCVSCSSCIHCNSCIAGRFLTHWAIGEAPWYVYTCMCICGVPQWLSKSRICLQCRNCRSCRFDPWVGKIPWRARQPTPVFQLGESHGQKSLAGYSPKGQSQTRLKQLSAHTCTCICVCIYI